MTQAIVRIATMPPSRPADYCLGYFDDSVFIDFDNVDNDQVRLTRISFDRYGCCKLGDQSVPLSTKDSAIFKSIVQYNISDQAMLLEIVKKAIALNKEMLWEDALSDYCLL